VILRFKNRKKNDHLLNYEYYLLPSDAHYTSQMTKKELVPEKHSSLPKTNTRHTRHEKKSNIHSQTHTIIYRLARHSPHDIHTSTHTHTLTHTHARLRNAALYRPELKGLHNNLPSTNQTPRKNQIFSSTLFLRVGNFFFNCT